MLGRTAVLATAFGLTAGSALVVVPSATIRVTVASTPVTATATEPLAAAGGRSLSAGPLSAAATVATSGVRPPQPATGTVVMFYGHVTTFGIGEIADAFARAGCGLPGGPPRSACDPPSPPDRVTLPAGTRVGACGWLDYEDFANPPCRRPSRMLVTTEPVTLSLGGASATVRVRAVAPGPAGDPGTNPEVWLAGGPQMGAYRPFVGLTAMLYDQATPGTVAAGPAVGQADLDKATAATRGRLDSMLQAALAGQLRGGEQQLGPLQSVDAALSPDHPVDTLAGSVTVSGRISAKAGAIDPAGLRRLALGTLQQAARGRHVVTGSVRWDPPALGTAPDGSLSLTLTAHGITTSVDPAMLRSAAAWHGVGSVAAAARRFDAHAAVRVECSFGWSPAVALLDRRVGVVVDGYPDG